MSDIEIEMLRADIVSIIRNTVNAPLMFMIPRVEKVFAELSAAQAQRDKAVFALQGLLEDITDYQTINNLGGENNHWRIIARVVLKECGK